MKLEHYYDGQWREQGDAVDLWRVQLLLDRVEPGEKVLEISTGPGLRAVPLAEKGAQVTGFDVSPVAVERARAKGVDARQFDPDDGPLPYEDAQFDVVLADSSVEHFFYAERLLGEAIRVLRPAGRLLLLLPNIAHWRYRLWLLFGKFPYLPNTPTDESHLRFFTLSGARRLLTSKGMQILETDGYPSLWVSELYPHFLSRSPLRQLYHWLSRRWPSLFARDFILVCRKRG